MIVLLIEDDDFKAKSLTSFTNKCLDITRIDKAFSVVEAITLVNQNDYDLILVDMAIPSHPITPGGGSPMSFLSGGIEILLELKALQRDDPCIIITQYPEIELSGRLYPLSEACIKIKENIGYEVLKCIEYSEDTGSWKKELKEVIEKL